MIRVLHVTPRMDYGGVASVVKNFYNALDHNEVIFDFVDHGEVEDYHQALIEQGSLFYYFKTIGKLGIRKYKQQIKNNIDLSKYDIVHIHLGDLTGVYAHLYRSCGAKHIINHAHGSKPITNRRKYFEWLLRLLAVREADACIGCGKEAGDFIFGEGNYILLPNGISQKRFCNPCAEIEKEIKMKLSVNNRKVITNIGNLQAVKNQTFLLDVINAARIKSSDILLVVAGEGPERKSLEKKIEELGLTANVILAGTIVDIPELLGISNLFVLPSLHEGIPVSALEAQATGIPCIFSDNIDHSIDIGNGNVTFLPIDHGTAEWCETILEMVNAKKNDNKEEISARLAYKGYDIQKNALTLLSIYRDVLNS